MTYWKHPKVREYCDVLATHPGVSPVPPEVDNVQQWGRYSIARSVAQIRKVLESHSDHGRRIFFLEAGWHISRADGGEFPTTAPTVSPLLQAAYMVRYFLVALRLGVDVVTPFFVEDVPGLNGGFFLREGTQRPVVRACSTLARLAPRPVLLDVLLDGEHGMYAYEIATSEADDADKVVVAWSVTGPDRIPVSMIGGPFQVLDMFGDLVSDEVSDQIDVGPCPVYLARKQ
jgi:hypothetical protein